MDLDSSREIDRLADQLLRRAGALRKFPTPVEDIIAAQRLSVSQPAQSPLAPGMLAQAPLALQRRLSAIPYKVMAMLDRRERVVHVHPDTLNTNHERFSELHEVGHDLCGWQNVPYEVDGRQQLAPDTQELFEREANYAGARLLFQGEVFVQEARSYETGMASVLLLANHFGSSIHSAFHQYVTTHLGTVAGYILSRSPTVDALSSTHYFSVKLPLVSAKYARTYTTLVEKGGSLTSGTHPELKLAWDQLSSGQDLGTGEIRLQKQSGAVESVPFELFSNSYSLFLLLNAERRHIFARSVRIANS